MIDKFNVACVSDVHLGHHRTKSDFIVNNLTEAFFNTPVLETIKLFFIAGDFFDRLLMLPIEDVRTIEDWVVKFLLLCQKHSVIVRVLEGTPSHDWRQSRLFEDKNRHLGNIVDLKYVDKLSVEYIPTLDATVLYVPDEWAEEADDTWKQVNDIMRGMGLDKVDFACMHGCFKYQLPIQSNSSHDEERYLSIVREIIFIGHHHLHTRHKRIFAEGSFDRLSHGEENPKGYGIYRIDGDNRSTEFVVNPGSKLYVTINLLGVGIEDAIKALVPYNDYPVGSHFRILTRRADGVSAAMPLIKDSYPGFHWTTQLEDLATIETSLQSQERDDVPKPITISRENIGRLIFGRYDNLDPAVMKSMQCILEQVG
jgi:hypothetical protein